MKRRRRTTATSVDWSSLPGDLVEQISDRLSTDADHLHIHQVCAHWRACTSPPPTAGALRPWILDYRRSSTLRVTPAYYSIWLPCRRRLQRKVDTAAPPPGLPYCVGASRGWLALVDHTTRTRLVLWDPDSGAQVRLPALKSVFQIFLSADPLVSPDWVAVARHPGKSSFCRPGDAAWSLLCDQPSSVWIKSIAFHGGRIYYTDMYGNRIVVCDLTLGPGSPPRVHTIDISHRLNGLCMCDYFHFVYQGHILTCAGELLLVVLRARTAQSSHPFAEIYKLLMSEWTPESERPLQIIGDRVMDLGEHSLFLGDEGESFALSAKEFPAIKRNHVYGLSVGTYYVCNRFGNNEFSHRSFVVDLASDTFKINPNPKELLMDDDDDGGDWRGLFWFCHRTSWFVKKHQHVIEK